MPGVWDKDRRGVELSPIRFESEDAKMERNKAVTQKQRKTEE